MAFPRSSTEVLDPDGGKQTALLLPPDTVRKFPEEWVAEFTSKGNGQFTLTIVNPATSAALKRYKIVRHKGSAYVSVPRNWLRENRAKAGDWLDLTTTHDDARILVSLRRK